MADPPYLLIGEWVPLSFLANNSQSERGASKMISDTLSEALMDRVERGVESTTG